MKKLPFTHYYCEKKDVEGLIKHLKKLGFLWIGGNQIVDRDIDIIKASLNEYKKYLVISSTLEGRVGRGYFSKEEISLEIINNRVSCNFRAPTITKFPIVVQDILYNL